MTVSRLDNVLLVVEDLDATVAFFVALGLEEQGRDPVEGDWVDKVVGLRDVRQEVVVLKVPGTQTGLEVVRFQHPAATRSEPVDAPPNVLGWRRVMFAVDDVDAAVELLRPLGGELVGSIEDYQDVYRLCYVRGPEGVLVGLAQELGPRGAS